MEEEINDDFDTMSESTSSLASRPLSRSDSDSAFDLTDGLDGIDQTQTWVLKERKK